MPSFRTVLLTLAAGLHLGAIADQPGEGGGDAPAVRRSLSAGPVSGARSPRFAGAASASAIATNAGVAIPPAPEGVTDLRFNELFKPVGPRGLEHSDKLRSLDGRRVRILGYMVKQSRPLPWTLLLAPVPVTLHESEYGFAEDLPATVIHVFTPRNAIPIVPHTPGLLLLTGTLGVGNREEPDGRVSTVRLALDPPPAAARIGRPAHPISTNAGIR